jgi:hypothetical protein
MCRQRHDGDSPAGHVEELDAIALLLAGNHVALDERAHVSGTEAVVWEINRQYHVLKPFIAHGMTHVLAAVRWAV